MITIRPRPDLEERLEHAPYKSREDKTIADALDSYGISFFYKQPTLVIENGKRMIEYADFFLPSYNGLAIDYIVESNSGVYRRKKNVYQDNQIPAVLVSRKDLMRSDFANRLFNAIDRTYRQRSHYKKPGKY